jgi:hypothetical protein
MKYFDILHLFSVAESIYSTMRINGVFATEPDYLQLPFELPQYKAKAYAVVTNGKIKEIEIHYETGEIETVKSAKY